MITLWKLKGTVLVACNCDWGCPCNFNAPPTTGKCEGGWTWHVDKGAFGDVTLDGLNFSVYVNWPGAIHEGNGEGLDSTSTRGPTREQRSTIERLVGGTVGGPWEILGWTWPKVHGPYVRAYEIVLDGVRTRLKAGNCLVIASTTIKNPVNGHEARPGIVLPEGLIVKSADLGSSETNRLTDDISFDHPGKCTRGRSIRVRGAMSCATAGEVDPWPGRRPWLRRTPLFQDVVLTRANRGQRGRAVETRVRASARSSRHSESSGHWLEK